MPGRIDPSKVLFLGLGTSAVFYYRCMLPALILGADWCGAYWADDPDSEDLKFYWATGLARDKDGKQQSQLPYMFNYEVVVLQQPHGKRWARLIDRLHDEGVRVVYEVDDYLHGIKDTPDHDFKDHYNVDHLAAVEMCMERCDAVICSTDYIAKEYARFNDNIHVCQNGIDAKRYALTRPERETVNIGWAGATGHVKAVGPWFRQVGNLMQMKPNTCFVTIGQPAFARDFQRVFGAERAIGIPWAAIEQYPGAMTMMDIALAPSGRGKWWRGKSDLRWLEAGALGIPVIASRRNYPDIEHGVTGYHAASPEEAFQHMHLLVGDHDRRRRVGDQAREHILATRTIQALAPRWEEVLAGVVD